MGKKNRKKKKKSDQERKRIVKQFMIAALANVVGGAIVNLIFWLLNR